MMVMRMMMMMVFHLRTRSYLIEASEETVLSQYSQSLDLSPIAALLFEVITIIITNTITITINT